MTASGGKGPASRYRASSAKAYSRSPASRDLWRRPGAVWVTLRLVMAPMAPGSPGPRRARPSPPWRSQLQENGDRAVVDQADLHGGAEDAALHMGPERTQGGDHGADERRGGRARGGGLPGRAAPLGRVGVERELA